MSEQDYLSTPIEQVTETDSAMITTKFNWSAFVNPFTFAIGNRAWLGLLVLIGIVPIIGWIFWLVWIFVSGFNGEKWALNNSENHYRDEAEFRLVMSTWNRAGLVNFIIAVAGIVIYIIFIAVVGLSFLNEFNFGNY